MKKLLHYLLLLVLAFPYFLFPEPIQAGEWADGGTYTEVNGYGIHTFTSSGTFTPSESLNVEYLVVAGGGGGSVGGGGGAGGYRTGTDFAVTAQAYTITVGAGGAGNVWAQGSSGGDSVFSTITSAGGGGGGGNTTGAGRIGNPGGSGGGGGACGCAATYGAGNTPSTSPVQGYRGGANSIYAPLYTGGGGGGSAGVGISGLYGGAGGAGTSNSISGSPVTYATGGTGGVHNSGGTGASGATNTGNGGNGSQRLYTGGAGGSGIVIITYPLMTPPTIDSATVLSDTSIQWNFTDNSSNETGFKIYDTSDVLKATCATANLSSCTETGLTANTEYTRKVVAYNGAGNSSYSSTATATTCATDACLASGGTYSESGGYGIHTFTSSGTFTPISSMNVEVLVVGGGGGGLKNTWRGAGGGAGGLIHNTSFDILNTNPITVTIGAGGVGTNGENSTFGSLVAYGGGYGAHQTLTGYAGGSGGGGGDNRVGGNGLVGQGYAGGSGQAGGIYGQGGGGGAGGVGGNGTTSVRGAAGLGLSISISGSPVTYATGGLGGYYLAGSGAHGANGAANTGNGGGGARGNGQTGTWNGGNGGSGIVIVKYQLDDGCSPAVNATSHTITTDCSFTSGRGTDSGGKTIYGMDPGDNTTNSSTLTVQSGTLTITSADHVVAGTIEMTGGSIAIATGGKITPGGIIFYPDADADGYPASTTAEIDFTPPTNYRRRNLLSSTHNTDCNESDNAVATNCCTGGTVTTEGDDRVHTFTSSGTFSCSTDTVVQYLVIAGGGGAGSSRSGAGGSGGGGAGGLLHSPYHLLSAGDKTVTIGQGGTGGAVSVWVRGTNGENSILGDITATGGGGGGAGYGTDRAGLAGGSGGGAGYNSYQAGTVGGGTSGQGTNGGQNGYTVGAGGGGGGGAGTVGAKPTNSPTHNGGLGGNGLSYDISGTSTYYAGGGGGGGGGGNGGLGGGGSYPGGDGTNNTGGGGGATYSTTSKGGDGGSGIVIVRYSK